MQNYEQNSYTCSPYKEDRYLNQMKNHFIRRVQESRMDLSSVQERSDNLQGKINTRRQARYEGTCSY